MIFSTIRTENTLSRCSPPQAEDTTSYHHDMNETEANETQAEVRTLYWRFKKIQKQRNFKGSHKMIIAL